MMYAFQLDFNKIAQALELTKETIKGEETVSPSVLHEMEIAQKQFQDALYYNVSRSNHAYYY